MYAIPRGRAGPSSSIGAGSGFTPDRRVDACVLIDRDERVDAAAALSTSSLLDSPRRAGASKMSRMGKLNEGVCGCSTGRAAADIWRNNAVDVVARGVVRRTAGTREERGRVG